MSDTYDHNNPTNGTGAEPANTEPVENQQKEASEAKVSWTDVSPELKEEINHTDKPTTTPEMTKKPKPKKGGRPKGVKTTKVKKSKGKARGPVLPLDDFGFRKGSIRSKAAALFSRPQGATLNEIKAKLGSVQYNTLAELKNKGFKVTSKEEDGKSNRPQTRFWLHLKKR